MRGHCLRGGLVMKRIVNLNNNMRIKNMACLYHAITNVYDGDIPVDVYVSYDGNISISPSRSYGDVIERILLVRDVHGEHTDTFSLYTYDDDYDEVIYDEKKIASMSLAC